MRVVGWGLLAIAALACVEDPDSDTDVDAQVDMEMRVVRLDQGVLPDMAQTVDGALPDDADVGDAVAVDMALSFACSNGLDDDGDGVVDHPDDPGCDDPQDDDETDPIPPPQCNDGLDNDADDRIDRDDPDCSSELDPTEGGEDPLTECSDGLDNDENGESDWPEDRGCHSAGDPSEGAIDLAACANEMDDDADGLTDYPLDPGCGGRGDRSEDDPERPSECSDGIDNDENGVTDFPDDPGCTAAGDSREVGPCGADVDVIDLNAWLAENAFYDGTTVDAPARTTGSCGGGAGGELIFTYRVDRPLEALSFTTNFAETASPVVMYLRADCLSAQDALCDRGTANLPGRVLTIDEPAEGLYFLFVDTGSRDGGGAFRLGVDVVGPPECQDTFDNDADGLIDADDPGCTGVSDRDETDPDEPAICNDGLDNDMDGEIDYPADPDCVAQGAPREAPLCPFDVPVIDVGQAGGMFELPVLERVPGGTNGTCEPGGSPEYLLLLELDDPSDVTVQIFENGIPASASIHARTDCADVATETGCRRSVDNMMPLALNNLDRGRHFIFAEQGFLAAENDRQVVVTVVSNIRACNNLIDDDLDELIDLDDPGCTQGLDDSENDPPEVPECADGIDNDEDGNIDFPADPNCDAAGDVDEALACELVDDVVAVPVAGGRFMFDTRNRPNNYSSNCAANAAGGEIVYALRLERARNVTVEITEATFDTALHMRTLCDDAATQLVCDDDGGLGTLSRFSQQLQPGEYFIFVDGFGERSGTGTVQFTIQ